MDKESVFGRIKRVRIDQKLNQTEFGARLGVGRSVIANIEIGRVNARAVLIRHMCEVFGVDPEWVYTGQGDMYMNGDEAVLEPVCEKYGLTAADKRLLLAYVRLPQSERQALLRLLEAMSEAAGDPV